MINNDWKLVHNLTQGLLEVQAELYLKFSYSMKVLSGLLQGEDLSLRGRIVFWIKISPLPFTSYITQDSLPNIWSLNFLTRKMEKNTYLAIFLLRFMRWHIWSTNTVPDFLQKLPTYFLWSLFTFIIGVRPTAYSGAAIGECVGPQKEWSKWLWFSGRMRQMAFKASPLPQG